MQHFNPGIYDEFIKKMFLKPKKKCIFLYKLHIYLVYIYLFLETPLTIACSVKGGKCREIVLTLVGGGGHLDFRNKKGMTALHKAVLVKNPTAVKVLNF